ncbi:uncharacterized protein LOC132903872 isoform X2 [Amyelois transitella]|uniref:uncharacterized protein LOC106142492 n=1 Tax=Amyelois transitella TaxID=680683 RepID=UPI00067B8441|nr:uncharacterized protein LOC106142492 [Amyelois transitella]XP_060802472.1 uncharacterized protein LOC132902234 [Amyelois transitella]XP_060807189.1 uncharacterized protein LOC132903292 [Amyelois transitella]XP_060807334.1 uncharacterized protein LOC132903319 [Amyelois transitella]XP_060808543.1 uncharacterized protein LOC132903717 [Amyelois transitella]XP_060809221.1 uncharacterized protein LOC132903872 isoform X2 [Amyelois transitella]
MSTLNKKVQYFEFSNKRTTTNIWNHFLRASDGQSAKCKTCHKILKISGGSTTGLHTHFRSVHPYLNTTNTEEDNENVTSISVPDITPGTSKLPVADAKKRKLVTDFFRSGDSIEVVVSRMAALDGCTFRFLTESQDLRNVFKKSGYDLPKSSNTIGKIIFTQAEEVKAATITKILELKTAGERFALTLDEWTSLRNKRYMNINLHSKGFGGFNFKNLGLVKISGSMPAQKAFELLRDHLAKFKVSVDDDVISQTTDGASVMIKMGTYFKGYHQLCLAHGIQLAVIDTLYKLGSQIPIIHHTSDEEFESDDTYEDDEDLATNDSSFQIEIPTARASVKLYPEVISKVRSLVKSVRKSPLKADTLRDYVLRQHGKEIQLQLDCRTRWSSMSDMIGVFLKLKDSISKALIDWKSDISFSENDIQCLNEIHHSLNVVKLTVMSLCRRETTLYTADTALKFMLKKLDEQDTFLSKNLASNLRSRIKARRLLLAGVLHYLHDAEDFFAEPDNDTFPKPDSNEISDIVVNLLSQLKYKTTAAFATDDSCNSRDSNLQFERSEESLTLTLQEQLEKELEKCQQFNKNKDQSSNTNLDLLGFVQIEKAIYDNGGQRGIYLTEAYKYLMCILPTSVESERVFSSAGYFCNRLRSSLSDKMLHALLFLRTHYQEQRLLAKIK